MTGRVRQVAPVRRVTGGGARSWIEPVMEKVEKERPREWAPVDSPQVPAGEGRLDQQDAVEDSRVEVGAQVASRGKGSEKESGTNHSGGGRWLEEEHEVVGGFGGIAGQQHHDHHRDLRAPDGHVDI